MRQTKKDDPHMNSGGIALRHVQGVGQFAISIPPQRNTPIAQPSMEKAGCAQRQVPVIVTGDAPRPEYLTHQLQLDPGWRDPMTKTLVRLSKVVFAVVALVLVCYGLARAYLAHEITMAGQMLNDLEAIKIGDSEDVVRSISRKYDGWWRDWASLRRMYEKPDYQYVVQVDPWRFWHYRLDAPLSRFDRKIGTASTTIAPSHRKAIGLRRWSVIGIVSIRQKHVVAVTTQAIVEGRNEWLGGSWYLYETIPDYEIKEFLTHPDIPWPQRDRYLVGSRRLDFGTIDGVGESAEAWITPSANPRRKTGCFSVQLGMFRFTFGVPDHV
jgi:hypothetical protein